MNYKKLPVESLAQAGYVFGCYGWGNNKTAATKNANLEIHEMAAEQFS